MFKKAAVLAVSCGAVLVGCGTDLEQENQEIISNLVQAGFPADDIMVVDELVYVGRDAHVTLESSQIISNLIQAGFPADDIQIYDGLVYTGRDAHVTLDASREMLQP